MGCDPMTKYLFIEMRHSDELQWPVFLVDDEFPANNAVLSPVGSYEEAQYRGHQYNIEGSVNVSRSAFEDMVVHGVGPQIVQPPDTNNAGDTDIRGDPDIAGAGQPSDQLASPTPRHLSSAAALSKSSR